MTVVLEVAGLAAAVGVPIVGDRLSRPRIEITPSQWIPARPTQWTFATVQIRNKPLGGPLGAVLTRRTAQGCSINTDFLRGGTGDRIMPTVPSQWIGREELADAVPYSPEIIAASYAGAVTMDSRLRDIPVSYSGEEVAVAVLSAAGAFAFSSESYMHDAFGNPAWRLAYGTYRIVVHVTGSGVDCKRAFKLEYLSSDFSKFRLQKI
jgi:hypothetical protein